MSNAIYIELTSQGDKLVIAIPIGHIGYHQPWELVRVQYGADAVANIRDSKFFSKHPISELPKENMPPNDIVSNKLPEIKEKLKTILEISKQINK